MQIHSFQTRRPPGTRGVRFFPFPPDSQDSSIERGGAQLRASPKSSNREDQRQVKTFASRFPLFIALFFFFFLSPRPRIRMIPFVLSLILETRESCDDSEPAFFFCLFESQRVRENPFFPLSLHGTAFPQCANPRRASRAVLTQPSF